MVKPTHVIEMNGTEHTLTLGLGFLEKLEELPKYQTAQFGLSTGLALQKLFILIGSKNAGVFKDIVKYGTMTNAKRPSDDEIEAWVIEQLSESESAQQLATDFLILYKKLPGAKAFLATVAKTAEPTKKDEKE